MLDTSQYVHIVIIAVWLTSSVWFYYEQREKLPMAILAGAGTTFIIAIGVGLFILLLCGALGIL